jgi:F-type H+-transporting ATPase subunit b
MRFLLVLLATLQPTVALASSDGGHGMATPVKLAVMTINLGIFLYGLHRYAWPMVVEYLAARRTEVVDALDKAARVKREAEALRAEWKERMANLDAELEQLRAQARADVAAERELILKAAQTLAANIKRDAERAAEQELRSAEELLLAEVAKSAYEIACNLAPQKLQAADHRRFVDEFIERVAK